MRYLALRERRHAARLEARRPDDLVGPGDADS